LEDQLLEKLRANTQEGKMLGDWLRENSRARASALRLGPVRARLRSVEGGWLVPTGIRAGTVLGELSARPSYGADFIRWDIEEAIRAFGSIHHPIRTSVAATVFATVHGDMQARNVMVGGALPPGDGTGVSGSRDVWLIDYYDCKRDCPIASDFARLELSLRINALGRCMVAMRASHGCTRKDLIDAYARLENVLFYPPPGSGVDLRVYESVVLTDATAPRCVKMMLSQNMMRNMWAIIQKWRGLAATRYEISHVDYYRALYVGALQFMRHDADTAWCKDDRQMRDTFGQLHFAISAIVAALAVRHLEMASRDQETVPFPLA